MTTKMDAVYEGGKLLLSTPLPLPDIEREAWLTLSEQSLLSTWDNPADDLFNELLSK